MLTVLTAVFIAQTSNAKEAFPSTYKAIPSADILIQNATILTGTGARLADTDILLKDGKIVAIGQNLSAEKATKIDANGRWITPGLIDVHSHLGVYASPGLTAHSDGNEMIAPSTPNVWAEHAIWPQDPGFSRALAGGVTSMQILPGSANLFGGRGVTVKNVYANSYQAMKFPDAPHGLKMACGENPKRVYGSNKQAPMTRMGNVAGYRQNWAQAQEYMQSLDEYSALIEKGGDEADKAKRPKRDLKLETLVGVLRGEIKVHMHCYRADEMLTILDLAKEFDYKISTFHHGVEAYKIADELAEAGVCGALWADWWGFKAEAYDGVQENIAMLDRPEGSCAILHSDSSEGIQRLNQEAAKAMSRGNRVGMKIAPERAIQWLTSNPAKSLGIEDQTGTLVIGKMADVVIWNQNPFSVYAHAEQVFIDGALVYDRDNPALQPVSDFELGQLLGEKK
ncbi:MAG: amidohydrolase family protein [Xanthomonadales bacterium]|nr:amidohydrolase family protein [Xanthomonadales bacterium]